jgi:hypothetical protein
MAHQGDGTHRSAGYPLLKAACATRILCPGGVSATGRSYRSGDHRGRGRSVSVEVAAGASGDQGLEGRVGLVRLP